MTALTVPVAITRHAVRRFDRVALVLLASLALLALWSPAQAEASVRFTLTSVVHMAPFVLLSVAVAAYAKASGADQLIARAFSGRVLAMIFAASLFGALSPFCSCGVIPLIAALLGAGMPLPAVMAFWLASPVMDPEMFILTAAELGLQFATAKTVAAVGIGLLGGFATFGLERLGALRLPLKGEVRACGAGAVRNPKPARWAFWHEAARRAAFADEARRNGWFLFKWLALAFLLESLMLVYLPAEAIGAWLGAGNRWAVPAAAFAGAPAYLNGFAAIPTVDALLALGMGNGAALAFMVAGGVTSIPAAVAVFALVRRPVFLWYLVFAFTGATVAGVAFDLWLWI